MPQQTNAIVAFYLGPQLGWQMLEPLATPTALQADDAVVVRLDLPQDEHELPMQGNHDWAMPANPAHATPTEKQIATDYQQFDKEASRLRRA